MELVGASMYTQLIMIGDSGITGKNNGFPFLGI